jgi:hypothetical protein
MTHFFLGIAQWLEATTFATALRESLLMFPIVEGTHLLALGVSVGTIAIVDLRLLGITMRQERVSDVMGQLLPWSFGGFIVMVVTGVLLFWANATLVYISPWFRLKMLLLLLAGANVVMYQLTIHQRIADWDQDPRPPMSARIAGGCSLLLWALVIAAGRTMAYKL